MALWPQASHSEPLQQLELPTVSLKFPNNLSLSQFSAYTKDSDGTQPLEEIVNSTEWKTSEYEHLNFGFSDSAYWLATKLQATNLQLTWYLRIRYALFDNIQIYLCTSHQPVSKENCKFSTLGDDFPFEQRDIQHPEFISKIAFESNEPYTLFLRFKTQGSYPLMIKIEDEVTLQNELLVNSAIRGGYLSMMLVMGLYNLFLYFSTKSRSYLYYSGFVLTFMLFHATYAGSAFQFLWPNNPGINQYALPIIFSFNMACLTLFIPKFLNLRKHGIKSFYLFRIYLSIAVAFTALSFVIPYQSSMKILNILNMIFTVSALIISARFWILGNKAARFFTIAWLAFIIGLLLATSRSLGLTPLTTLSFNGYQYGSFIEIILLSLALGERITQLQKDKIKDKKALFVSQENSITNLRKYEDLYENSTTGQFQLDKNGNFLKYNPAWLNIISTDSKIIPNNLNQCFILESDSIEFWKEIKTTDRIKNKTLKIHTIDSKIIVYIEISMRQGEDSAWIGSAQDISDKYRQEQELKQLQFEKNQSLRQLIMGVSHEMNTPLGNIKMAQTHIQDYTPQLQGELKNTINDGLEIIKEGAGRLQELGSLMKGSVASKETHTISTVNISHWLSEWINSQEYLYDLLKTNLKDIPQDLTINCYQDALNEVLNHLIENSIRHNNERYKQNNLEININIQHHNSKLHIRYKDNGVGIETNQRHSIFQPFYTTQRQSAANKGLGLYYTYNLITEILSGQVNWPETTTGFDLMISIPTARIHSRKPSD